MMSNDSVSLQQDALVIWSAGVEAVNSTRLVASQIAIDGEALIVCGHRWLPEKTSRICVVGAGKAGAGMVAGLQQTLPKSWQRRIDGWVNVPENCVSLTHSASIHLHPARPAGVNEPTQAGVNGSEEILKRVSNLRQQDLCLVLISGGGSALLPAPVAGLTVEQKQLMTRFLMHRGATIQELNTVRRSLSRIKGGGLLRACRAGMLVSLIISDVIGDPMEMIASGPTVPAFADPVAAKSTLKKFWDIESSAPHQGQQHQQLSAAVDQAMQLLDEQIAQLDVSEVKPTSEPSDITFWNHIVGNNRTAVEAAAESARQRGYQVFHQEWDQAGIASEIGRDHARKMLRLQSDFSLPQGRYCILSGGEPIVELAETALPRKGGRNQEFVLAAAAELMKHPHAADKFCIVSGGTDGEDGPTEAAGGVIDSETLQRIALSGENPEEFLAVNNSYPFLEKFDALIRSGPTHTNVMDLRVVLVEK